MPHSQRLGRGRLYVVTVVSLLAVAVGVAALLSHVGSNRDSGRRVVAASAQRSPSSETERVIPPPTSAPEADPGAAAIARTPRYPTAPAAARIVGAGAQQPDLYAAEFVRRLLSRNYATSRDGQLRWVQSESASTTEPLVIGLVPEGLRDRFAVWSVTDETDGRAPVPSASEWARLGAEHTVDTATVQRVDEPMAWAGAVQAGRITDPGITAREVDATVSRRTGAKVQTFSVAASLNLEGPPVQRTWGVVAVITYTAVAISAS